MKNFIKNFYKGIIIGAGIISAMIGGTYIYTTAFSTLSSATTGQSLTSQMWNDVIDRVSNIFWNSGTSNLELNGGVKIGTSSTCNTSNKGVTRYSTTASRLEYCDGTGWNFLPGRPTDLGADASSPGLSCKDIYTNRPASVDGIYRIKPDANNAVQVRCDMTNGGRTLVNIIKATSEHGTAGAVGSLTDKNQSSYWKIADTYINNITKTSGYKLKCATTTVDFPIACVFGARTTPAGQCIMSPGGGCTSNRWGMYNHNCAGAQAGTTIYAHAGAPSNGCRDGATSNWGAGELRVR